MQGMVVVGLIVEELSNIAVKCVKYRSRSPGQGTCQASAMRLSAMQGLVVVCLFMLRFYGPVNPMGSCRARSFYLTTRLLGRLSPLSG